MKSKKSSIALLKNAGFSFTSFASGVFGTSPTTKKDLAKFLQSEYGQMIPKTNISNLPDYQITELIRIISEFHNRMKSKQNYVQSKRAVIKLKELGQIELIRQIKELKQKQSKELMKLERDQTAYANSFQEEWDSYLAEEEKQAKQRIEELFTEQKKELESKQKEFEG